MALAHRGGAALRPENSWSAFEHAVALGYSQLETDARATADGALLAFHDATLDRVTDHSGRVADLRYAQVRLARILGTEPIPLIEDLLDAWPAAAFAIDVKDEATIVPLVRALGRTGAWNRVSVTSFSLRRLRAVRRLFDRPLSLAWSVVGDGAVRLAAVLREGRRPAAERLTTSGVRCIQVPTSVATAPVVHAARGFGLRTYVWTVNRRQDMESVLDAGADGVITDEIAVLRDLLVTRGQWQPASAATAARPPAPGERRGDPNRGGSR